MILNNLNLVQLGHYVVPQTFSHTLWMDGAQMQAIWRNAMQSICYLLKRSESEKWRMRDRTSNRIESHRIWVEAIQNTRERVNNKQNELSYFATTEWLFSAKQRSCTGTPNLKSGGVHGTHRFAAVLHVCRHMRVEEGPHKIHRLIEK